MPRYEDYNSMVGAVKSETIFKIVPDRKSMIICQQNSPVISLNKDGSYISNEISGRALMDFTDDTYEKIFNAMMLRLNKQLIIQHKCHNCGANVEIDEDKHVFVCPYCGSVYAIGTLNVNDGRS